MPLTRLAIVEVKVVGNGHIVEMHARKWSGFMCKGRSGVEYRVSLAEGEEDEEEEEEEGEKSILDCVWFSGKTTVLDSVAKYSSSISHVDNDGEA